MKKLLALLFVCAGLTAMAVNPVHTAHKAKINTKAFKKSCMVMKDNTLTRDLTYEATKLQFGKPGSLHEFVKAHDMKQNMLMKRAPRRSEYADIAMGWLYSGIENTITDGQLTPSWYSITGTTFEIYETVDEEGYCIIDMGVMPFVTDPYAGTSQSEPGKWNVEPEVYAWFEPATDSLGLFGGIQDYYPISGRRTQQGSNNYRVTATMWGAGLANEEFMLGTGNLMGTVAAGPVDWETGMIELDGNFGTIEEIVGKTFTLSRTDYNKVANAVGAPTTADYARWIGWALYAFPAYCKNTLGVTWTETTTDSAFYKMDYMYTDNVFLMANATHYFDEANEKHTPTEVQVVYNDSTMTVTLNDSIVPDTVPVFAYQKQACDSIYVWNLWGMSNVPNVEFALDAQGTVTFPWQFVYYEDMTSFNEYAQGLGYDRTYSNEFVSFHSTYSPYSQDGVEGYYLTDFDWDDTPCKLNEAMNEITWHATDVLDIWTTESDEYMHVGVGYSPYINNKLVLDFALTLPQPAETWQPGDVNHDGEVDVADVALMIKVALGQDYDVFYWEEANLDDDPDNVDIGDVSALINIVLGKE